MSVSKTAYKTWRVRVDVGNKADGSRAVQSKTFKTKREAVAYEALMREKARTCVIVRDKIRLKDYMHEWYLPDVEKRVLPVFSNVYIDAISRVDVQHMIDGCKTPKLARRARDVLRQVLKHAKERTFVKDNAAEGTFKFPAPSISTLRNITAYG